MSTLTQSVSVCDDWQIEEIEAKPVSLIVQLRRAAFVFPWFRFVYAEGNDSQVRITFATHLVTVTGNGLAALLLGIALVWHGAGVDWIIAGVLAMLVCLCHVLGLLTMAGMVVYIKLAQHTRGWARLTPLVLAVCTVLGAHWYVLHLRSDGWVPLFYLNGSDQFFLYGDQYGPIALGFLGLTLATILYSLIRLRKHRPFSHGVRIALELWAVLVFAAAMIPEIIFLPQFAHPFALLNSRSSMVSAMLLLCVLACLRPQRWEFAAFSVLAAAMFALLYGDTAKISDIEERAAEMFRTLPYGSHVIVTIGPPAGSRIWYICHSLDRACMGRCFTYSDYEPPSGQFWIHARAGSRTATSSSEAASEMESGVYQVKPVDLPLKQIYQCRVEDTATLCMRDLHAGETNCAMCNQPLYWLSRNPGT